MNYLIKFLFVYIFVLLSNSSIAQSNNFTKIKILNDFTFAGLQLESDHSLDSVAIANNFYWDAEQYYYENPINEDVIFLRCVNDLLSVSLVSRQIGISEYYKSLFKKRQPDDKKIYVDHYLDIYDLQVGRLAFGPSKLKSNFLVMRLIDNYCTLEKNSKRILLK